MTGLLEGEARKFLEKCKWDFEEAIVDFIGGARRSDFIALGVCVQHTRGVFH